MTAESSTPWRAGLKAPPRSENEGEPAEELDHRIANRRHLSAGGTEHLRREHAEAAAHRQPQAHLRSVGYAGERQGHARAEVDGEAVAGPVVALLPLEPQPELRAQRAQDAHPVTAVVEAETAGGPKHAEA